MSDAKKKMMDMVNKKAKVFKEYRTNSSRSLTPNKILLIFIKAIEYAQASSSDQYDFDSYLNKASNMMLSRFKGLDPNVNITIHWNTGDSDSWQELMPTGITITWSDDYIKQNPDKDKEETIDIVHLLLEGMFDE